MLKTACVVQAVVMCGMSIIYMYVLLERVADQRYTLFSCFLSLPSSSLRSMVLRKALIAADEEEEEEDEQQAAVAEAEAPQTVGVTCPAACHKHAYTYRD
jgi:hypothetical protein